MRKIQTLKLVSNFDVQMAQRIFNIRGSEHEISEDIFNQVRFSDCEAAEHIKLTLKEKGETTEFHFNRQISCTNCILEYFNGEALHLPLDSCPSKFKNELIFWGISETEIETCCFTKYISFFQDMERLKILENGEKILYETRDQIENLANGTGWTSVRARLWRVVEYPTSSFWAKIYLYLSNALVLLSLFVLICSTHPTFQRKLNNKEWKDFFTDEEEEYYNYNFYFDYEEEYNAWNSTNTTFSNATSSQSRPLPTGLRTEVDFIRYLKWVVLVYFTVEIIYKCLFFPLAWKRFFTFLNLIDFFAVVVMFMSLIVNEVNHKEKYQNSFSDAVHSLQIIRVFRLFRLVRHISGFRIMIYTLRASILELLMIFLAVMTAVLLFSSMVYFSRDPSFSNIPEASWWAIITLTTVGYGDHSPVSVQGKLVGATCAVTGVCLLAILIPVLVNNFLFFNTNFDGIEKSGRYQTKIKLIRCSSVTPETEKVKY